MADGDIARGECLAVIPRRTLLSCANTDIADLVSQEKEVMDPSTSSWIPLLIALAGECTKKVSQLSINTKLNRFLCKLCTNFSDAASRGVKFMLVVSHLFYYTFSISDQNLI